MSGTLGTMSRSDPVVSTESLLAKAIRPRGYWLGAERSGVGRRVSWPKASDGESRRVQQSEHAADLGDASPEATSDANLQAVERDPKFAAKV